MAPDKYDRQYGIVLLGATGYTGTLTAAHIVQHLPKTLHWAIAGRSMEKLKDLRTRLKELVPDRVQPGENIFITIIHITPKSDQHTAMEIVSLDQKEQLNAVLRKTTICLSVVSYARVGTQVVEACVENRTDYVDA